MSSFYDDASLVVIPSGYKTSKVYSEKPTDGSGDLDFTRTGDTATRVNSAGLIEKVRTNLVLQSNSFDTTWGTANGASVTGGQSGYDGSSDAWLLTKPAAGFANINQAVSISGVHTYSVYLKAGTNSTAIIRALGSVDNQFFIDLSTGTSTYASPSIIDYVIEDVGGGWYRCSISVNDSGSVAYLVYPESPFAATTAGNIYIQSAQLESGDIATDYIPTTTAAVSVGPTANTARLDYLGSTCPRLLLEPQRTNLVTYSEQFNNAAWGKTTATVTANTTSAPDGTISADTFDATNNFAFVSQAPTLASGTATTYSVFVKNIDAPYVNLQVRTTATAGLARFDFTGSTLTSTTLTTGTSSSFTDYGNGWYRCVLVCTTSEANQQFRIQVPSTGDSVFIWGAQAEAGTYATSYIPTLAASATRGADACSKTGISSLIGQTEGTWYYEGVINNTDNEFQILNSTRNVTNSIAITRQTINRVRARIWSDSVLRADLTSDSGVFVDTKSKIALSYKSGEIKLFYNGALVASSTSSFAFTVPISELQISVFVNYFGSSLNTNNVDQVIIFPTALSDADAIALTA